MNNQFLTQQETDSTEVFKNLILLWAEGIYESISFFNDNHALIRVDMDSGCNYIVHVRNLDGLMKIIIESDYLKFGEEIDDDQHHWSTQFMTFNADYSEGYWAIQKSFVDNQLTFVFMQNIPIAMCDGAYFIFVINSMIHTFDIMEKAFENMLSDNGE